MGLDDPDRPRSRRDRLAIKGRLLYGKSCGPGGERPCAEGFALHHLRLGEPEVALDLLAFLDARIGALTVADPEGLLPTTEALAARIRGHLEADPGGRPTTRPKEPGRP